MKVSLSYRIASVLLVLFAAGHTLGFRQILPEWGVGPVVASMRAIHFNAQGFNRTYYDFYVGFGFFVSVFLLFLAVLAWQLGGMRREILASIPQVTWSLAVCSLAITVLSWKYFFAVPIVFSMLITLGLFLGAWFAGKPQAIRPNAK
jgi:cobalamin biosynthesis protein CobD/CbiB